MARIVSSICRVWATKTLHMCKYYCIFGTTHISANCFSLISWTAKADGSFTKGFSSRNNYCIKRGCFASNNSSYHIYTTRTATIHTVHSTHPLCAMHINILIYTYDHAIYYPKWKAMMMRVRLMRRPMSTRITDSAHSRDTTTVGYHRNTCVLPRNGSATKNRKEKDTQK